MIKGETIKLLKQAQEIQVEITAQRIEVLQEMQKVIECIPEHDLPKSIVSHTLANVMVNDLKDQHEKIFKMRIEISKFKLKL